VAHLDVEHRVADDHALVGPVAVLGARPPHEARIGLAVRAGDVLVAHHAGEVLGEAEAVEQQDRARPVRAGHDRRHPVALEAGEHVHQPVAHRHLPGRHRPERAAVGRHQRVDQLPVGLDVVDEAEEDAVEAQPDERAQDRLDRPGRPGGPQAVRVERAVDGVADGVVRIDDRAVEAPDEQRTGPGGVGLTHLPAPACRPSSGTHVVSRTVLLDDPDFRTDLGIGIRTHLLATHGADRAALPVGARGPQAPAGGGAPGPA
jgi:hypothetical protein